MVLLSRTENELEVEDDDEEESLYYGLSEDDFYLLEEEEEDLTEEEIQISYSTELPRPFQSLEDIKVGKDGLGRPSKSSPMARTPWLESSIEPGVAQLTRNNFNNVIQHAYSNTLFYGKKKKKK